MIFAVVWTNSNIIDKMANFKNYKNLRNMFLLSKYLFKIPINILSGLNIMKQFSKVDLARG